MHVRGSVSADAGPDATTEGRVEALEKNVEYVNARIDQIENEIDERVRAQTEAVKQEQQARAKEDQDIRAKLETAETGGLHIPAIGAVLLFVGVILSTASAELAKCLSN